MIDDGAQRSVASSSALSVTTRGSHDVCTLHWRSHPVWTIN